MRGLEHQLAWLREMGGEVLWRVEGRYLVLEGRIDPSPYGDDPIWKRHLRRDLRVWHERNPFPAFLGEDGLVHLWGVQVLPAEGREAVMEEAVRLFVDAAVRLALRIHGDGDDLEGPVKRQGVPAALGRLPKA